MAFSENHRNWTQKNVDEYQDVEGALKIIDRFPGLLSGIRSITKKNMIGRKNDIKTNDCNSGNSQRR